MEEYKAMYYMLFNKVSDIICQLQEIQQCCEEICMEQGKLEEPIDQDL